MEDDEIEDSGEEMGMPEIVRPEKTKALEPKTDLILGGRDLKTELQKLESDTFDHLNSSRKVDQYWGNIKNLDVAIQNDMDDAGEHSSEIKKIENNPDVRGQIWDATSDPWYAAKIQYDQIMKNATSIISYKDWQIEFLKRIVNKLLPVIEKVQHASEESIKAATTRDNMEFFMEKMANMYEKRSETDIKIMENAMKGVTDAMKEMAKGAPRGSAVQTSLAKPISAQRRQEDELEGEAGGAESEETGKKPLEISDEKYIEMRNAATKLVNEIKKRGEEPVLSDVINGDDWANLRKTDKVRYESAVEKIRREIAKGGD